MMPPITLDAHPRSAAMPQTFSPKLLEDLRHGQLTHAALHDLPLLEEYRLLRITGQGAMGLVYLAQDTLLDRAVAIKFLVLQHASGAARERFLREARALAKLSHPNVVTIFRIGEVAGHLFLVSEFVRGQTLAQLSKPMPWQRVLELGLHLARGLAAVHRQGILHRDIKPANVVLSADGTIKLIDFGLAKLLGDQGPSPAPHGQPLEAGAGAEAADPLSTNETSWPSGEESLASSSAGPSAQAASAWSLTQPGARIGTPRYMAPELWRGEPAGPQADIYALGVMLYELCCGAFPHSTAPLDELAHRVQRDDAPPLAALAPGVSAQLCSVIDRCLRRLPEQRFRDGEALCLALEQLAQKRRQPVQTAQNPYRGLCVFESEHAFLFCGREQETSTAVDRLREQRLLLVTGDSGVGKSSLCRAGVLPRVLAGEVAPGHRWVEARLLPGRAPMRALSEALSPVVGLSCEVLDEELRTQPTETLRRLERLAASRRCLILFVDQLEELITQSPVSEAEAAAALLGRLAELRQGVRILATARSDFLTRLVALPLLGEQVERGLYLLPPLSRASLRSAIVTPAEASGYHFTSETAVTELIEAALTTPGGLPLLQFTLSLLWEARDGATHTIPDAALAAIGGVAGALARYADSVLAGFLPAQREAARRLLPFLVSADGLRLRRSIQDLLLITPDAPTTLEALVQARLLVVYEQDGLATYQLAHEALVSGWGTLRELLDRDREGRVLQERLSAAAAEWERLGESVDALWGEQRLAEVARTHAAPASESAQRFLRASERRLRQQQRGRVVRYALALSLPLLATLVFVQYQRVEQARRAEAEQRRLRVAAETLELGTRAASLAQTAGRETIALKTAVQLVAPLLRRGENPPAAALLGLSTAVHAVRRSIPLRGHTGALWTAFFSPDGSQVVTASNDGTARLWDAESGSLRHTLSGHHKAVRTALFLPAGDRVLTASEDGTIRLWDVTNGHPVAEVSADLGPLSAAYPSPDGKHLLLASFTGRIGVWEVASRRRCFAMEGFIGKIDYGNLQTYRAFSPDSRHVAIGKPDGSVGIHEVPSGALVRELPATHRAAGRQITYAWYAPDATRLAVRSGDSEEIVLYEPATGRRIAPLGGHPHPSLAAFSADSRHVVTTGNGLMRLWDARTGAPLSGMINTFGRLGSLRFSPDGQQLVTTGEENTVRLWDMPLGQQSHELRGHADINGSADYSPDGTRIVTSSWDGTARIWSQQEGVHSRRLLSPAKSFALAVWAPDGRHIAMTEPDEPPRIFDVASGRELTTLNDHNVFRDDIGALSFSPDGKFLAVGTERQRVSIWEWSARRFVGQLVGHQATVSGIVFSADGERLLTVSADHTARLWDWRNRQTVALLPGHTDAILGAALSADARRAATVQLGGLTRVFALPEGRLLFSAADEAGRTYNVGFSPDGGSLVVGGMRPRVLDANDGALRRELHGHLDAVSAAQFSRDGRRILTASTDQTIRLWDAESGQVLHILTFDDRDFSSVEFSPDGAQLLFGSMSQHSVKLFPTRPQQLLSAGCALLRHQPEWPDVAADCKDGLR